VEQEKSETIVVYAPRLHAALVPQGVPVAVCCLDPGLGMPHREVPGRESWTPADLPLEPAKARAWLGSMISWGLQFDSPGQLTAMAAAEAMQKRRDFGGMGQDELGDLQRFASGAQAKDAPTEAESVETARVQAQLRLLLAWNLEERAMELLDLGQGLASQYQRFGQALGLDDDEQDDASGDQEARQAGIASPVPADDVEDTLPGIEAVGSMLAFLPAQCCLYSDALGLVTAWRESGLEFIPLEDDADAGELAALLGPGRFVCRAPGWKLAGLKSADPSMPWLEREYLAATAVAD